MTYRNDIGLSLNNTDYEYCKLLLDIKRNGIKKADRTGTGTTSVFGRQIRLDMGEGFPLLTQKKLHVRSIIHELLWFLNGDTNIKYLNDNGVTIWDEWADKDGNLGPVYGKQWVAWGEGKPYIKMSNDNIPITLPSNPNGINQIQQVIDQLKNNPDSRRIMVSAWNVGDLDKMALPPCHYGFQLYTRELSYEERYSYWFANNYESGMEPNLENIPDFDNEYYDPTPTRAVSLMWNQRSVDVFLGLPFNIASYGFLLCMIAQQVGMVPDELIGSFGDAHIYDNHWQYVDEQIKRDSGGMARLSLDKADDIFSYKFEDFKILDYHPKPNWKNVPIAV